MISEKDGPVYSYSTDSSVAIALLAFWVPVGLGGLVRRTKTG